MLDSKKAKRTAALQRVRRALGRHQVPWQRDPWQSGLALEPLILPLPRTPVVVQASTEAGEVPESPFVLDTSNPYATLGSNRLGSGPGLGAETLQPVCQTRLEPRASRQGAHTCAPRLGQVRGAHEPVAGQAGQPLARQEEDAGRTAARLKRGRCLPSVPLSSVAAALQPPSPAAQPSPAQPPGGAPERRRGTKRGGWDEGGAAPHASERRRGPCSRTPAGLPRLARATPLCLAHTGQGLAAKARLRGHAHRAPHAPRGARHLTGEACAYTYIYVHIRAFCTRACACLQCAPPRQAVSRHLVPTLTTTLTTTLTYQVVSGVIAAVSPALEALTKTKSVTTKAIAKPVAAAAAGRSTRATGLRVVSRADVN
eukprot:scaffold7115_cov59-Phaeocystis_antarctica.AAC.2